MDLFSETAELVPNRSYFYRFHCASYILISFNRKSLIRVSIHVCAEKNADLKILFNFHSILMHFHYTITS